MSWEDFRAFLPSSDSMTLSIASTTKNNILCVYYDFRFGNILQKLHKIFLKFVPDWKICTIKISTNYKYKPKQTRMMIKSSLFESEGNEKNPRVGSPLHTGKKFMKQIEMILCGSSTGVKDTS